MAGVSGPSGDPASCSLSGGTLRRLASRLGSARAAVLDQPAGRGRVSRTGTRHADLTTAARRDMLLETTARIAAALDRAGTVLQQYAADLAESIQAVRALEERASTAGLELGDGGVRIRWGVTGVADPRSATALEQRRVDLQRELDGVTARLRRRRTVAAAELHDLTRQLAGAADRLGD